MSLRFILFDTTCFSPGDDREETEIDLIWAMEALVMRDVDYLRQRPKTPRLYKSGVVWQKPMQFAGDCAEVATLKPALGRAAKQKDVKQTLELIQQVFGGERFRDIGRILENGAGDCFPLTQKIIVRSKATNLYELLALGELRHVYPSYEALSYNFTKARYEFRDIVGFTDKGQKPTFRAHLSNGTDLVATGDHKFWTLDGAGENGRRLGVRTMAEYAEAMTMSRPRRTARSRILQAARIPALGAVHPSSATAYLAGMYAAEGNFDGHHTNIAQHKTKVRAKIEAALADVGTSFRYREAQGKTPGSGAYYALHGGRANPIVAMMREQGLNSFDRSLPNAFLSGDEATLERMIEGHGDGDAWRPTETAYKRPGVEAIYATSSDLLMEQLRFALLALGRPAYAYRYEDHGGEGDKPIWRLHEYGARENTSTLRKRRQVVEGLGLHGLTYGNVRSVEDGGRQHVGCIEVEGNHNFFLADGTLVSNCDNLATWRCAELRIAGITARPMMTSRIRPDGGVTYHAIVRWPPFGDEISGNPYEDTDEDPSLLLGMAQPERKAERDEEIRKNAERCDYIRRRKLMTAAVQPNYGALVEDVLGLRRTAPASIEEQIERLMYRRGA